MNSKALTRAATVAVALIAVATIGSELSATFKQLLSLIGGHHWIGKSVLSVVFFGLLYLVFSKLSDDRFVLKDTLLLIGTVMISGLAILAFYVWHA
ncbi:MAG: hypothetical protein QNK19_09310 [Xanthomonadales bacterium]|nr:hypothetical protein [Xanthomonadales bacterium]